MSDTAAQRIVFEEETEELLYFCNNVERGGAWPGAWSGAAAGGPPSGAALTRCAVAFYAFFFFLFFFFCCFFSVSACNALH